MIPYLRVARGGAGVSGIILPPTVTILAGGEGSTIAGSKGTVSMGAESATRQYWLVLSATATSPCDLSGVTLAGNAMTRRHVYNNSVTSADFHTSIYSLNGITTGTSGNLTLSGTSGSNSGSRWTLYIVDITLSTTEHQVFNHFSGAPATFNRTIEIPERGVLFVAGGGLSAGAGLGATLAGPANIHIQNNPAGDFSAFCQGWEAAGEVASVACTYTGTSSSVDCHGCVFASYGAA